MVLTMVEKMVLDWASPLVVEMADLMAGLKAVVKVVM